MLRSLISRVLLDQRANKLEQLGHLFPWSALLLDNGLMLFSENGIVAAIIYLSHYLLEFIEPLIHHLCMRRSTLVFRLRQHKVNIIMLCRITNPKNSLRGLLLLGSMWFDFCDGLKLGIIQIIHRRIYGAEVQWGAIFILQIIIIEQLNKVFVKQCGRVSFVN